MVRCLIMKEVVLLLMLSVVAADITSIDYPPELKECLNAEKDADARTYTGESVAGSCIATYCWYNKNNTNPYVPSQAVKDYIRSMSSNPKHERTRRGTFPTRGKTRKRKEYRLLSRRARERFHDCLNLLKTTPVPNGGGITIYDAIAAIHNAGNARSAHGGVNFLSWHRVYIYTLENALRAVNRRCRKVTLPYWDCTAEYYSDLIARGSSEDSIIFSEGFAGNADGTVSTGPFRTWGLVRNVGFGGSLFGRAEIEGILTRTNHGQITVPNGQTPFNLEFYHNSIHRYLGGLLLDISLAPRDPMFFLLHTYVDFLWEQFRQSLIRRGLDAEAYPPFQNPRHAPDNTMEGFPEWTNREGYLNDWNDRIAEYRPTFNCDQSRNCRRGPSRSRWIGCVDVSGLGTQCVAIPRQGFSTNFPGARRRRAAETVDTLKHTRVQMCDRDTCPYQEASIQNTYVLNDKIDPSGWVYVPVNVVFERSKGLLFNTYYSYTKKHILDIFDPSRSEKLHKAMYTGEARTYDSCRISRSGSTKVFVRADGISYSGNSVEYTIADERYPITMQKAYVPVKDPSDEDSRVCLMAYDECGRICLPTCLVKGSDPPVYVPCSGCIRVDSKTPKRYGKTIPEIVSKQWEFHDVHFNEYMCPEELHVHTFVKFVCDSSTKFPWQRLDKYN
uniref:Tyrosinase 2 n=1 Tax=Azumapecten farreri TaxID=106299 RepID=A0A222YS18_AZUFA|nr:tyrosinase 2 [Azumapecten farreri]